ncbi:hypothetical protein GCM10028807_53890 [Spirosoma daeguense]
MKTTQKLQSIPMKKQFNIKPVQVLKNVSKTASKSESNNILQFVLASSACCYITNTDFKGISKPVFSL